MKKYIFMIAAVVFIASGVYAATEDGAYQAATTGLDIGGSAGTTNVKSSKGVMIGYKADTTAGLGYVLGSYHTSGTQTYATSSGDTKIFKQDGTGAAVSGMAVPTGSNSADFSSWTAM